LSPEEKLKGAFVEAVGMDSNTDFDTVRYGYTDGWDSVAHMQLVAAIENAFDIMLSTDEVINLSSYHKGQEIVASHGVEFAS
jgi:acyl carrier protein